MNDIISVIVPIYNSEKTLYRCIISILNSVYKELQIILVNDGSTDQSKRICDEIKQKDNRIEVFHLKNGGVSRARNYGLDRARGKFVAFIDSDDFVKPEYFYKLKQGIEQDKCQLSVGSVAHIRNENIEINCIESGQVDFIEKDEKDQKLFLELNQKYLLYGPCNKLYYNYIIKKNNIKFPENIMYGEDLLFNMDYLNCIDKIVYNKEPIYYYDHNSEGSLSQKYREDRFENGIKLNLSIEKIFKQKEFWKEEEKKFVYQRIFDDAYNSIFDLWNPQNTDNCFSKIQRIKYIVNHKEVEESCRYIDKNKYSKKYIWMITNKKSVLFVILRLLKSRKK